MKPAKFLPAALFFATAAALAAEPVDPVRIDVYLAGKLEQHVTLVGPNSGYVMSFGESPKTTLELRLVAPEPIIVDLKETSTGDEKPAATARVKLVGRGGTLAVDSLPNAAFRNAYVLVRPE